MKEEKKDLYTTAQIVAIKALLEKNENLATQFKNNPDEVLKKLEVLPEQIGPLKSMFDDSSKKENTVKCGEAAPGSTAGFGADKYPVCSCWDCGTGCYRPGIGCAVGK